MSHKKNKKRRGKKLLIIFITILLVFVASIFIFAGLLSLKQERSHENQIFKSGTFPHPALDGEYQGNKQEKTDWLGKKFNHSEATGVNRFPNSDRYIFRTTHSKSLRSNQDVLQLNYNLSSNPLWLRPIVDEITQTEPGKYDGKVYIKLGPLIFTLTYFQLSK